MTRIYACPFDLGHCRQPVTTALRVGQATTYGTLACDLHAQKVRDYQHSLGVTADSVPIAQAEPVDLGCAACWRSHGCGLSETHDGEHVCAGVCGDRPRPDDEVFACLTFEPCARVGGVTPTSRLL